MNGPQRCSVTIVLSIKFSLWNISDDRAEYILCMWENESSKKCKL